MGKGVGCMSGGGGRDEGVGDAAVEIDELRIGECKTGRQGNVFGGF
jgi:hypothetical protein